MQQRATAASTPAEKERLPRGLVLAAGAGELRGVLNLPRVVEHDAQADEVRVDRHLELRQRVHEQLRGFLHDDSVPHEPWWSAELGKNRACGVH